MKGYGFFALLLIVLLPFSAQAAGIPAGFAPSSLFASETNISAGDSVVLFAVLYNSSDNDLTGDLIFTIDGSDIGTKHFSLTSGQTQTPSISWSAVQGTHTATAHIENVVGSSDPQISLMNDKTDSVTLTVAAPPPPSASAQAVQSVTNIVQNAAPAAQTAFNSLESLRQNAVNTLTTQLSKSAPESAAPDVGAVLGTSTYLAAPSTSGDGILSTVWHWILEGLLFVCQLRWLFYLMLLVVIYILYKIVRTVVAERH